MGKRSWGKLGWIAALLCLLCLPVLLVYALPWGVQSADWSILPEDGQEWQGANGWTLYVVREGERVLLTPDGTGGYDGCAPGEAFFRERTWDVDISEPTLRLHANSSCVAVWLNGALYYADAPLAEGSPYTGVALPQLAGERYDPVEIALYDAAPGDTLILAQTAPLIGEKPDSTTVYPCGAEVVSAYGYERGLIASAYDTGLMCALLALLGVLLCALAAGQRDASLLPLALLAFTRAACAIVGAPFFSQYTLSYFVDLDTLCSLLSFTLLLVFLAMRLGRTHGIAAALAALHGAAVLLSLAVQLWGMDYARAFDLTTLPETLAPILLLAELGLCLWRARQGDGFCRLLLRALAIGLGLWLVGGGAWLAFNPDTLSWLLSGQMVYERFLREPVIWLTQSAVLIAVLVQAYRRAAEAREERLFAALRAQAVEESYENLRAHQNEVRMLRHEMNRHYTALKGLLDEGRGERAARYVDELLSQQARVPKLVDSANELVNIVLGSRVARAEALGLRVEIDRMNAPARLPLSDAEAASLLLNIVDNAIEAARGAEKQPGVIRLSLNCKNGYFTFSCENTAALRETNKAASPYRGYGLHVIERIMAPYGNLMTVRREAGRYAVSVALPLMEDRAAIGSDNP